MTVADVIVDGLRRAGTPRLFATGPEGGGSMLDAVRRAPLPVIQAHDATSACVMAAVTGQLCDAPGAALVALDAGESAADSRIAGAAAGIAHALARAAPMILITEPHPPRRADEDVSVFASVAKASLPLDAASAAHWIAHAAQLAMKEPRGPVHLHLRAGVGGEPALPVATSSRPAPLAPPDGGALEDAARRIGSAASPVLLLGRGSAVGDVAAWVRPLAESLPAPVLVTPGAKGVLPDPHPLNLGVLTEAAMRGPLLSRADLVVTLGLDAVELPAAHLRAPVARLARASRADGEPRPAVEVVGDLALIVEELAPRLRERQRADWDVAELDRLKRAGRPSLARVGVSGGAVVRVARELTPAGTIASAGAAVAAIVTALWDAVAPNELLVDTAPATLGFALSAAIAAQLLHPERRVLAFESADDLLSGAADLDTIARLRLPVVAIVVNGSGRGDVVTAAQRFAVPAFSAGDEGAFRRAVVSAVALAGPALIDARIDATADAAG